MDVFSGHILFRPKEKLVAVIKLRRDYPKAPPGGWNYQDPSGVVITSSSLDGLLEEISSFRLKNSLPPGRPEYELTLYFVERYPDFVERTDKPIDEPTKTIEDRLTDFTNKLWRSPPGKLIPLKLAIKRIETCMACPHRRDWSSSNDDQDKEIVRKLVILSQGGYRAELGYCAAFRAHPGLLVLIKEPDVRNPPMECWVSRPDSLVDE